MLKVGLPEAAVRLKMAAEGVGAAATDAFFSARQQLQPQQQPAPASTPPVAEEAAASPGVVAVPAHLQAAGGQAANAPAEAPAGAAAGAASGEGPGEGAAAPAERAPSASDNTTSSSAAELLLDTTRFARALEVGFTEAAVRQQMGAEGVPAAFADAFFRSSRAEEALAVAAKAAEAIAAIAAAKAEADAEAAAHPPAAEFADGQKVEVNYKGKGKFYAGVVSAVAGGGSGIGGRTVPFSYDVQCDDGDTVVGVREKWVRAQPEGPAAAAPAAVGEEVEVRWGGGPKFFPARVTAANADGTYHITFADGDEETAVRRLRIKRAGGEQRRELAVGAEVDVFYKGGQTIFPGKVESVGADGTYGVVYDDGDTEAGVKRGSMLAVFYDSPA
jgi:hypothetical protein